MPFPFFFQDLVFFFTPHTLLKVRNFCVLANSKCNLKKPVPYPGRGIFLFFFSKEITSCKFKFITWHGAWCGGNRRARAKHPEIGFLFYLGGGVCCWSEGQSKSLSPGGPYSWGGQLLLSLNFGPPGSMMMEPLPPPLYFCTNLIPSLPTLLVILFRINKLISIRD